MPLYTKDIFEIPRFCAGWLVLQPVFRLGHLSGVNLHQCHHWDFYPTYLNICLNFKFHLSAIRV